MQYAIISNNTITKMGTMYELFPNISFPVSGPESNFIIDNNLVSVKYYEEIDSNTFKLTSTEPYLKGNVVYTYQVVAKTQDDYDNEAYGASLHIREQRNQLLKDSDWTQVEDTSANKAVWAIYRKALRDITTQEGFPFNVTWPDIPTT